MDDVLVFGQDQEEHDKRFEGVLHRIQSLNPSKCEFSKNQIKFLGHIVNQNGVQADPAKTLAVSKVASTFQCERDASICGYGELVIEIYT